MSSDFDLDSHATPPIISSKIQNTHTSSSSSPSTHKSLFNRTPTPTPSPFLVPCYPRLSQSMGSLRHTHHPLQRRRHIIATLTALALLLFASTSATLQLETAMVDRRRLGGLGSSPPKCRSKCGTCSPCKPVHVPIQPGLSMPLEYYPEAWRCKCRNKLFMP
ncbi:hypothetical protein LguiB_025854 [Lonicera macranthoides]